MRWVTFLLLALLAGCARSRKDPAKVTQQPGDPGHIVETKHGRVVGTRQDGVLAFKGIPFAKPPTGEGRWRAPEPPAPWSDVRHAKDFPPPCAQNDPTHGTRGVEDCLYLNVWTKEPIARTPRPVLFFVHGGGNVFGSTSEVTVGVPLYDGGRLAQRRDVVVVTAQYRLGIFGWFAHEKLAGENEHRASGNYGILDLIAALRWVKENIARFGGDPSRILVFGESAGGVDTCALVASPVAAGLFSAALVQSGGCGAIPASRAKPWHQSFVGKSACGDDLLCLRRLGTEAALKASAMETAVAGVVQTPSGPIVDGWVLPDAPLARMRQGKHNHVPIVFGTNRDETASPLFHVPHLFPEIAYEARVKAIFGADAPKVLAAYPASAFGSARAAWIALTSDGQFVCPARAYARAAAANQTERVYRYQYTHVMKGTRAAESVGAAHGFELFYVFQWIGGTSNYTPTPADFALERDIAGYWTRFAKSGDPNGDGAPVWPAYDVASDPYLELGTPIVAKAKLSPERCDLFDTFYEQQRW